jgi:cyclopropane fatty-acyl-phospholipid synthase-like methyltransferase
VIKKFLTRQFGNPKGMFGYVVGLALTLKNRKRLNWAAEVLDVQENDSIMEMGCGPGVAVELIASKLVSGHITAFDRSPLMTKMAISRNRRKIQRGTVSIITGTIHDLEQELTYCSFNKIFAFNVSLFWRNPVQELITISCYLKKGGYLYIFHQPPLTKEKSVLDKFIEETKTVMIKAGYIIADLLFFKLKQSHAVCIVARLGMEVILAEVVSQ